jgi:aryl-alcohol dehydrogenase-like predicted oxidoreductase
MEYVNLGRSGLKVSRLTLGGMGFGDPAWRSWVHGDSESRAIIRRALDLGINAIDTCDYYSSGRSEEIVGRALKDFVSRPEIVIATKLGNPMGKGPNDRGFSRKHVFDAVDQSLKRLQVEYIDLYQTHIWDPRTNLEEMMQAFHDLVRSGKVLYIGITDMPFWQFATAHLYAVHNGLTPFSAVQNHYNAIWREDERDLLPFCRANGIGLIPYSPMGRGFLCGRRRRAQGHETERVKSDDYAQKIYGRPSDEAVADSVEAVAKNLGSTPAQIALAWVLSRQGVHSPVFGATKPEHVDAAVAALSIRPTSEAISRIEGAYLSRPAAGHGI